MSVTPLLELRQVSKSYDALRAVEPTDFSVNAGDFLAILGPSGCGKTTLLRMIGGFIEPTSGTVLIDNVDMTRQPPEARPTNMVFQGYGLFPHMTVRQNITYGLKIARRPADEIEHRLHEMLELGHLNELADRPVTALSGGQQQRVALVRALILKPKVLLLDEPLAALDLKLRSMMQDELRRIHAEIGGTFVFVTHDQGEAMALASKVAVMNAGRIVQVAPPEHIYRSPKDAFVANFLGEANLLPMTIRGGSARFAEKTIFSTDLPDGDVLAVIRPEDLSIQDDGSGIDGSVVDSIFHGIYRLVVTRISDGNILRIYQASTQNPPDIGSTIHLKFDPRHVRLLPTEPGNGREAPATLNV